MAITCRSGHQAATQNFGEREIKSKKNVIVEWVGKKKNIRRKMISSLQLMTASWPSIPPNTTLPSRHLLETSQGLIEDNDTILAQEYVTCNHGI